MKPSIPVEEPPGGEPGEPFAPYEKIDRSGCLEGIDPGEYIFVQGGSKLGERGTSPVFTDDT